MNLGKHKKTLSDTCADCGDRLQTRSVCIEIKERGYIVKTINKDQIVCVSCGDIKNVKPKKTARRRSKNDYDIGEMDW